MTKNHEAVRTLSFLLRDDFSLCYFSLSIPEIPPFFFIFNSRNPSFPSLFSPSSLLGHFLLITGWLVSQFFPESLFSFLLRDNFLLSYFLLSIPEIPPFLLITGQVPTFLFFCQSRKSLLSIFIFRKHETHTSLCSLDGFLIYQGD